MDEHLIDIEGRRSGWSASTSSICVAAPASAQGRTAFLERGCQGPRNFNERGKPYAAKPVASMLA